LNRALIGIVAFITVAILGIGLYLTLTDFSEYRSKIEAAVTESSGREFRIGGDLTLDAVPPVFIAEDVTWANADWASGEPMMSVGHVTVRIDGSSLLFEPLVIEEFILRDVRVMLETNESGESNWTLETDAEDDGIEVDVDADDGSALLLRLAEIENITVVQRSPGSDDREFHIASLGVTTTGDNSLTAEGNGSIDGQAVTFNGNIGPVDNLPTGQNLDVSLDADFGFLTATARGNTGNPETLDGTAIDVLITSDDLSALEDVVGMSLDLTGTMQADAVINAVDGVPTVEFNLDIDGLATGGTVQMNADRMTVDATVSSLPAAGAIAGVEGLPDGPGSVKGDVLVDGNQIGLIDFSIETSVASASITLNAVIDGDSIVLDPFAIESGESDLAGTLSVNTADPLQVEGDLRSSMLDLTPLTGAGEAPAETGSDPDTTAEPAPASNGFVLSEDPLPFDFLNAANIDVTMSIEEFRNGPLQLRQVENSVKLADGTLTIDSGLDVAAGGEADATFTLSSQGESATLDVEFELSGFRPTQEATSERPVEDIPLLGLSADIESSGNSAHAIAAAANGKVILTQGPGKVDNRAFGLFSSDLLTELLSALNPFAKEEPYSNWECTVFGMDIVDGVGTINSMLAQSEKVTIVGDGKIDFNDEALDISFNTKPRRGVGVSADMFLTPFIRLGGTMSSPRLALDKSGVLISGGAAVLTGGLSFLVQGAADRATGAADRCGAALALAQGQEVDVGEERDP
jgi:uncharacterized protein involved in outer membrane biogenesis